MQLADTVAKSVQLPSQTAVEAEAEADDEADAAPAPAAGKGFEGQANLGVFEPHTAYALPNLTGTSHAVLTIETLWLLGRFIHLS